MKRWSLLCVLLMSMAAFGQGPGKWAFTGTVIRMKMGACTRPHGFSIILGSPTPGVISSCPEYTIKSDKVVYVVVGTRQDAFMPLAEDMKFLVRRNELITISQDEKNKSRFTIEEMTQRAIWDREEARNDPQTHYTEHNVNYEVRNPPRASVLPAAAATTATH